MPGSADGTPKAWSHLVIVLPPILQAVWDLPILQQARLKSRCGKNMSAVLLIPCCCATSVLSRHYPLQLVGTCQERVIFIESAFDVLYNWYQAALQLELAYLIGTMKALHRI